jgi:hypothetical protein
MFRLPKKSFDGNSSSIPSIEENTTERDIPEDVILEIVKYLSNAEILRFCLVVSINGF